MPPPPRLPLLLDPASAGALWRASRLEGFRDRAAAAGLLLLSGEETSSPSSSSAEKTAAVCEKVTAATSSTAREELASLLARASRLSSELDTLALGQRSGQKQTPWWADGEYDDAAADAANDRGVEALRRWKRERNNSPPSSLFLAKQALAFFTEAVRLRPSSATYCANRASAALACGSREAALEAAGEAVRSGPLSARAWALRGRALAASGRFAEAAESLERAVELDGNEGGGGGKGKASKATRRFLGEARASEAAAVRAAAAAGGDENGYRALPRDVSAGIELQRQQEQAGEALEAAERALRAEPRRHELLRSRVEVKIIFSSSSSFSTLHHFFYHLIPFKLL